MKFVEQSLRTLNIALNELGIGQRKGDGPLDQQTDQRRKFRPKEPFVRILVLDILRDHLSTTVLDQIVAPTKVRDNVNVTTRCTKSLKVGKDVDFSPCIRRDGIGLHRVSRLHSAASVLAFRFASRRESTGAMNCPV